MSGISHTPPGTHKKGLPMLQLKKIRKEYKTGDLVQTALNDVSLNLRDSEFVAILGPSGSGKTTLLNIIGGLDRYDSGDLVINGISTKKYTDRDWDSYRNHTIGFVFQSYNLIPHQTVLANVELALTISGISGAERKRRATEALQKVGLGNQLHKHPSEMSGGQMQRVAIARALVNNPDILLADEPTGALDSETSIQVMELLKEVAKDRLVVMVTHNPELAQQYATLTVKGGTFTYNGNEAMTSASVPVDAEVKVTLNQSAVPEGMVFDLWAMDEASLLGNPAVAYNEESFTIPAGSVAKGSTVTVEAQYRDATIESEPSILGTAAIIGVAGAGTAVIVWQGYRIGMELYEKYFQPTPEETAVVEPTLEGQMTDPIS